MKLFVYSILDYKQYILIRLQGNVLSFFFILYNIIIGIVTIIIMLLVLEMYFPLSNGLVIPVHFYRLLWDNHMIRNET